MSKVHTAVCCTGPISTTRCYNADATDSFYSVEEVYLKRNGYNTFTVTKSLCIYTLQSIVYTIVESNGLHLLTYCIKCNVEILEFMPLYNPTSLYFRGKYYTSHSVTFILKLYSSFNFSYKTHLHLIKCETFFSPRPLPRRKETS